MGIELRGIRKLQVYDDVNKNAPVGRVVGIVVSPNSSLFDWAVDPYDPFTNIRKLRYGHWP